MTMSDNSTYMAGVACMAGKENFWIFIATTPTIPADVQAKVMEQYKELGFTAPVAIEGKSPVYMKKFVIKSGVCA